MPLTKQRLEMFRGDTQVFNLAVTDGTGAAVNVTGWTFWMTAKDDLTDSDVAAIFQVTNASFTWTNAATGIGYVTIDASKTADLAISEDTTYRFDMQGKEGSGAIHTIAYGTLKVRMDTTRTTT